MSEIAFAICLILAFAMGAVAFYPTADRDNRIKAEVAVAVYEGRASCEQALGQWVCSIPKD